MTAQSEDGDTLGMQTTLDLPDELVRRAEVLARERGTTFPELVGQALAHELAGAGHDKPPRRRANFPIFSSHAPGSLAVTNAGIALDEQEEDLRRHGLAG